MLECTFNYWSEKRNLFVNSWIICRLTKLRLEPHFSFNNKSNRFWSVKCLYYSLSPLVHMTAHTLYWAMTSVVARHLLVVGSKSNLVYQGRVVQQRFSCSDTGAIVVEVRAPAQCRELGKTIESLKEWSNYCLKHWDHTGFFHSLKRGFKHSSCTRKFPIKYTCSYFLIVPPPACPGTAHHGWQWPHSHIYHFSPSWLAMTTLPYLSF